MVKVWGSLLGYEQCKIIFVKKNVAEIKTQDRKKMPYFRNVMHEESGT